MPLGSQVFSNPTLRKCLRPGVSSMYLKHRKTKTQLTSMSLRRAAGMASSCCRPSWVRKTLLMKYK
jgi:hypothetical protein